MGAESWATFALALLVALAVPGPDLVLVMHSATRGVREGASTAFGIVTGLMLHAVLAIAGASALLISMPGALVIVQVLGAGVLIFMGATMLRGFLGIKNGQSEDIEARTQGGYVRGLVTNATNPKALLFFAAILPQFIGQGHGAEARTVALCGAVIITAGLWWTVTIALVRLLNFHRSAAADRSITLLGGLALLLIGLGLLSGTVFDLVS